MALNFPDNPTINQIYSDLTSGYYYRWDGYVWQSFSPGSSSNIQTLDDISSQFNGVATSFSLTSNNISVTPVKSAQLVINLGGIVQDPSDDYSISGSSLIFSEPPEAGLSFSGISLGPAVPISDIVDGTIVPQDLSTGGPWWTSDYKVGIGTTLPSSRLDVRNGDAIIAGILTVSAGAAGTALVVQGNARITGILTVGTASITFDGSNNTASIGTSRIVALPSGSSTLWYQSSAPTGWTKITSHHDKCLRVVNTSGGGSGGITSFTSVFSSKTPSGSISGVNTGGSVSDTTLTTNQIPSHIHDVTDPGHGHTVSYNNGAWNSGTSGNTCVAANQGSSARATTSVTTGISIGSSGGTGPHNHGFNNPTWSGSFSGNAMDFQVQYVDMILASFN